MGFGAKVSVLVIALVLAGVTAAGAYAAVIGEAYAEGHEVAYATESARTLTAPNYYGAPYSAWNHVAKKRVIYSR